MKFGAESIHHRRNIRVTRVLPRTEEITIDPMPFDPFFSRPGQHPIKVEGWRQIPNSDNDLAGCEIAAQGAERLGEISDPIEEKLARADRDMNLEVVLSHRAIVRGS
jgi:hypothetical protein